MPVLDTWSDIWLDAYGVAYPPTEPGVMTLAQLKAHLNMNPSLTGNDAELLVMLQAALEEVENRVGRIRTRTVTETVRSDGLNQVILRGNPVARIVDPAGLTLTPGVGLIAGLAAGVSTVTYVEGTGLPTAAQALAILIIAADVWTTQRGAAGGPLQQDPDSREYLPALHGNIPRRAAALLEATATGSRIG